MRPLKLGEEKNKERKKIETTAAKYNGLPITTYGRPQKSLARGLTIIGASVHGLLRPTYLQSQSLASSLGQRGDKMK